MEPAETDALAATCALRRGLAFPLLRYAGMDATGFVDWLRVDEQLRLRILRTERLFAARRGERLRLVELVARQLLETRPVVHVAQEQT